MSSAASVRPSSGVALWKVGGIRPRDAHKQDLKPPLCGTTFWGEALMGVWPICLRFPHLPPAMVLALISPAPQEKNARLLGAAQQLFGHCQAQKEESKRLFQQKLDEVDWSLPGCREALHMIPSAELWAGGWAGR